MENASKALLIAVAILLTILIISLGIYMYNNQAIIATSKTNSQINEIKLIKFNKQYLMYEGNQKGSSVKILLQHAIENNREIYLDTSTIEDSVCIRTRIPEILNQIKNSDITNALKGYRTHGARYPESIQLVSSYIKNTKTYNIEFKYNDKGFICEIWINEPKKT